PTIATPPSAPIQPTADAPFPAPAQSRSSGISWPVWLLIVAGAIALVAVVGLTVPGLQVTGALGPVTSSDGVFSVKVPKGWAQGSAVTTTITKPVLALAKLKTTNGVKPEFVVADLGQSVPLAAIEAGWDPVLRSGRVTVPGTLGGLTRTTIAGAPALSVERLAQHRCAIAPSCWGLDVHRRNGMGGRVPQQARVASLRESDCRSRRLRHRTIEGGGRGGRVVQSISRSEASRGCCDNRRA